MPDPDRVLCLPCCHAEARTTQNCVMRWWLLYVSRTLSLQALNVPWPRESRPVMRILTLKGHPISCDANDA